MSGVVATGNGASESNPTESPSRSGFAWLPGLFLANCGFLWHPMRFLDSRRATFSARNAENILLPSDRVTKTIPDYLKIHQAPYLLSSESDPKTNRQEMGRDEDSVSNFWQAYTDATGWRIDQGKPSSSLQPMRLGGTDDGQHHPAIERETAERLASSAAAMANQLEEARQTLHKQSAELSARAAIVVEESRGEIAKRISEILADLVAATTCDAAAIYLLDDDTQELSCRFVHGLPVTRLADSPRELRGSRGDLEALVRGVVSVGDLKEFSVDTWCCPEEAGGAICAAIQNDGVPVGTLWAFSSESTSFGLQHESAAKLAAAFIATQLQTAASSSAKQPNSGHQEHVEQLAQWQYASLPVGQALAPGWRVDGMLESPRQWATGWHAWDVLPDGTIMLAIAEAEDETIGGAMTATISRAALSAHSGYRHTPRQMLQRISDTLWQTNTMDQLTSLLYAHIDPETGEGQVAVGGDISAVIASRYGYRPVISRTVSPLASTFDVEANETTFRLMPGEVLLAHTSGMLSSEISQTTIGNLLRESMGNQETCPLASVRRSMAKFAVDQERGAMTILRV